MPNAEYHSDKGISNSNLNAASKSGRHFWDQKFGPPRASTHAFDFGTAAHALILPGEDINDVAVRMPEGMKKTTKEGKAFVAEHAGKILLNESDAYALDQMVESVNSHGFARGLLTGELKGKSEQSYFATDSDTGLRIKARPDFITTSEGSNLIIDLKTTTDASPKGFQKSMASFSYYKQAAWYLDVVELASGNRPDAFLFVCIEKQRPFNCAVYMADEEMLELGRKHAYEDLFKIHEWIRSGIYPGYSTQVEMISLPKWMLPKEDGTPDADHQPIELY
tara:strand:+ start:756 stop:1592 length:837 start_codon:yes stop_codon:yes gene_type:complete